MDKSQVKALVEIKDGKMLAIASEESEDRDGEVISIDGWDLRPFKKNPVLLWYHNLRERSLPIGKVKKITKKQIGNKKKLVFEPVFEELTEFGRTVKKMFEEGFLNTFSVGFMVMERDGNQITKQELLEISAVPVPSLRQAEIIQRSAKLKLDEKYVKAALGDEKSLDDVMSEYKAEFCGSGADSACDKALTSDDMGGKEEEEKSVVPYNGHTPAPVGRGWDARAAKTRLKEWAKGDGDEIKPSKYKQAFTYFDEGSPDKLGSYKLPHHDVDAGVGLVTVWRGVAAAMAALLGARGGVQIPDAQRRGVYNHLKKHYAQFDKEVPEFRLVEAQVLKNLDEEIAAIVRDENSAKIFRMFKKLRREIRSIKSKKKQAKKITKEDLNTALKIVKEAVKMGLTK